MSMLVEPTFQAMAFLCLKGFWEMPIAFMPRSISTDWGHTYCLQSNVHQANNG